jgi:hypothetical protein
MSNCGCCSIIVKEKDAVNELLEVLGKNFDASSGEYFLSLKFYDEKYDWHYTAFSVVKIENRAEYIRFETEFRRFDALCTYLKFKGIDFIYEFTDERHGMGGLTNDMTGEFFKTCLCVVFDEMDDVNTDIPIGATDEYIESKIKEIEKLYNKEAIHSYTVRYCPDDYFELDENDRKSCEESIEAILSGKVEKAVENVGAVKEDTEDGVTVIDEPPF